MVYDVTMTVVWCLEVLDRRQRLTTSDMMFYGELTVAIYFLIESSTTLLAWDFKSEKIYLIFIDLIINSAAYSYVLITTRKHPLYTQPEEANIDTRINSTTYNPPEKGDVDLEGQVPAE